MLLFHLANLALTLICKQFVYNMLCCHIKSTSARIKKTWFLDTAAWWPRVWALESEKHKLEGQLFCLQAE